ncbi:hypothetical protein EYF80_039999 [Liparis tanakae]|uniref:Uncharacterized protein n=1 Tax=Liparis tanakae TaxID=230148 RepID=A0A4Z2G9P1_9TELE|nr:hypothetical protein EYF80_039999 [Liparis tanakae]
MKSLGWKSANPTVLLRPLAFYRGRRGRGLNVTHAIKDTPPPAGRRAAALRVSRSSHWASHMYGFTVGAPLRSVSSAPEDPAFCLGMDGRVWAS